MYVFYLRLCLNTASNATGDQSVSVPWMEKIEMKRLRTRFYSPYLFVCLKRNYRKFHPIKLRNQTERFIDEKQSEFTLSLAQSTCVLVHDKDNIRKMKGAHLSLYLRQRIIELSKIYARFSDVSRAFRRENPGRRTRKRTIARIIKKYRENGIICDLKKSGRPSRWQLAHLDFIDEQLELNDE